MRFKAASENDQTLFRQRYFFSLFVNFSGDKQRKSKSENPIQIVGNKPKPNPNPNNQQQEQTQQKRQETKEKLLVKLIQKSNTRS